MWHSQKNKVDDDAHRWKDILCSWIGRINVKITILFKAINRFSTIPIKIPMAFLKVELKQIILKFV